MELEERLETVGMHNVGGQGVVVLPVSLLATANVRDLGLSGLLGDNPALSTWQGSSAYLVLYYGRSDGILIQDR